MDIAYVIINIDKTNKLNSFYLLLSFYFYFKAHHVRDDFEAQQVKLNDQHHQV